MVLWQIRLCEIVGGISLMCQMTTIRIYEAWINIHYVLWSKTYSTSSNVLWSTASSWQAARSARICETRLLPYLFCSVLSYFTLLSLHDSVWYLRMSLLCPMQILFPVESLHMRTIVLIILKNWVNNRTGTFDLATPPLVPYVTATQMKVGHPYRCGIRVTHLNSSPLVPHIHVCVSESYRLWFR